MNGETPQKTCLVRGWQRLQPPEQPVRRDVRPPHAEERRIAENLQQPVELLRLQRGAQLGERGDGVPAVAK